MLPGVELARRRRLHHRKDSYLRGSPEPSTAGHPQPIVQPAAAAARRRLEEKLRRPFAGSRSPPSSSPTVTSPFQRWLRTSTANVQDNSRQVHASHQTSEALSSRNGGAGTRGSELTRILSRTDICAVCLDGFRVQQQVIWLPCAHRYHSSCVLPWLADHSHCPYCRTEVPSLELPSDSVL